MSLIVAGLCALIFSWLSWVGLRVDYLTLGPPATGPFGSPFEWLNHLQDVAGALGLAAMVCGGLALRWPSRAVAVIVGVALVLGAAFLVAWLVMPVTSDTFVSNLKFKWPAYAATIALVDAALSAFWLART